MGVDRTSDEDESFHMGESSKGIRLGLWMVGTIVGFFVVIFVIGWWTTRQTALCARTEQLVRHIATVFDLFKVEYGHYPRATKNPDVYQILNGGGPDNRRQIQFMSFNKRDLNDHGEIIDPWKTPYRVAYDDKGPLISSAGPDRKFGTKDDITNRNP